MSSKIYQEVIWNCPKCNYNNINTFLEIETKPVECYSCQNNFDVFLKVKLDIEILKVSDGTVSDKDKKQIMKGIKKAFDTGKINKATALNIMNNVLNSN